MREWMAESDAAWVELRLDAGEFRDLGDDATPQEALKAAGLSE